RSLGRWLAVLPRYADLQIAVAGRVDEVLELGVPDLRLASLPAAYDALVAQVDVDPRFVGAGPQVRSLCERLAALGVPETVQHDDLHDGQVFVRDGVEV